MPIATILGYLMKSPFTSSGGVGLIMVNVGTVLTMLGNGTPIMTVIQDPHFSALLAGFVALAAKDVNVTGGTRYQ